jgi:hypothetical protein
MGEQGNQTPRSTAQVRPNEADTNEDWATTASNYRGVGATVRTKRGGVHCNSHRGYNNQVPRFGPNSPQGRLQVELSSSPLPRLYTNESHLGLHPNCRGLLTTSTNPSTLACVMKTKETPLKLRPLRIKSISLQVAEWWEIYTDWVR